MSAARRCEGSARLHDTVTAIAKNYDGNFSDARDSGWWARNRGVFTITLDDPAKMIRMIGLGVDGLITNRPGVAKEIRDNYARMTEAERLLLFIVTSFGADPDVTPPPGELRP
jgi:hypothetical protein